jgi:predicted MFS family arabinose efflux permease
VGVGIALSGTLVPLFQQHGLAQTWLGLGTLAAIATAVGWTGWGSASPAAASPHNRPKDWPLWSLRAVYAGYALNAFALVPHMVFLVAYVARGLGEGLDTGTRYWTLYGLGSIVGPMIAGRLADRIGFRRTLSIVFLVETLAIGLLAINASSTALIVSSFAAGACTIGVVPMVLGRTRTILRHYPSDQSSAWRTATASFALFQAVGAYLLSFILQRSGGDYRLLFALGAGAMAVALVLDLLNAEPPEPREG